jgi:hypothetical protein
MEFIANNDGCDDCSRKISLVMERMVTLQDGAVCGHLKLGFFILILDYKYFVKNLFHSSLHGDYAKYLL